MVIIGITGTLGAGKGEVVAYLKERGFAHFSARDFIVKEVEQRGLPVNRDSTTSVANDLRKSHSSGYIIERLYAEALAAGAEAAIIESVRTPGEEQFLRTKEVGETGNDHFFLIAVDADPKLRYERISLRKSVTDHVSFEKFISDEQREMDSTDPTKGNIAECIRRADVVFRNNGTLEALHAQIEKVLPDILPNTPK